jgi:Fe-S cluster biosynthesis and repair protein YggX
MNREHPKTLYRPITKQIHVQHIEKIIHGINKNTWNNGNTHTGKLLQGTTHSYYFKINFKR